jgi:hypothetical protein
MRLVVALAVRDLLQQVPGCSDFALFSYFKVE